MNLPPQLPQRERIKKINPDNMPAETVNKASGEDIFKENIATTETKGEAEMITTSVTDSEDDLSAITEDDMIAILYSLFI